MFQVEKGMYARDHRLLKHNMNVFSIIYVSPSFRKASRFSQQCGLCPITICLLKTARARDGCASKRREREKENQRDLTNLFNREDSEEELTVHIDHTIQTESCPW